MLFVDAIAEKLDRKPSKWKPEISQEVRALVSEVIDAAGNDALDVMRSRATEQEVLDQLDDTATR
jgi:proline dehydrogenase